MTNSQIVDEAAEWFVALRDDEGDPKLRAQFAAWLCRSPEHVRVYLELTPIWAESASVDPERRLDAEMLIRRARADANVFELAAGDGPSNRPAGHTQPASAQPAGVVPLAVAQPFRPAARRLRWALAAAVTAAAVLTAWLITRPPEYVTGIGEQRSIVLPDGSSIELNARSRLRVRFSEHERHIDLLEGQGFFSVAKDSTRPFIVLSDDARVRALGTQFDVYRKASGTVVTVIEGQVEATTTASGTLQLPLGDGATPANEGVQLAAGEQAVIASHAVSRSPSTNIAAATAWQKKQVVFDSDTLADVAQEFNRYNFRQIVIEDPEAAKFLVSGVFSSTDVSSLMRFLMEQPELLLEPTDSQIVIRKSR